MSDQLLTFLKLIFLALLYLFFLRVLRAVWVELREPKPAPLPPPVTRPRLSRAPRDSGDPAGGIAATRSSSWWSPPPAGVRSSRSVRR